MLPCEFSLPYVLELRLAEPLAPPAPSFRLSSSRVGGHRLRITGDLDLTARDRLRRVLASIPPASDGRPLTLDLTEVTYLDCGSLKILLEARRTLGRNRPVVFRFAATGQARRVIALLDLEEILSGDGSHPG